MSTSKRTIDWYKKHADEYHRHVNDKNDSPYHAFYEKPAMYSELPYLEGKSVLSLGCGSGEDINHLRKQGTKKAVGIDITPELIQIAKKKYPKCDFYVMDMEKLDFAEKSFDLIYSSLAMHYILEGLPSVLEQAEKILKPGGVLLFSMGHPIETAMEEVKYSDREKTYLMGRSKSLDNDVEKIYGDYLTIRSNDGKRLKAEYLHEPIGKIINDIVASGLQVIKIVEPEPTDEFRKQHPWHYKRLMKIPEMIIYKAKKPPTIPSK